jgi:hypothetical protein
MACNDPGREVLSKYAKKMGLSRYWNSMMVFWAFPKQISSLKREFDEKVEEGHAELDFGENAA